MKSTAAVLIAAAAVSCRSTDPGFPDHVGENPSDVLELRVKTSDGHAFAAGSSLYGWQIVGKGKAYRFVTADGGAEALFKPEPATTNRLAYAFSPDVECDSLYRGSFYLSLDPVQKAVKGGYDEGLYLRSGKIEDGEAVLSPVVGTFRFVMDQADVYRCTFVTKGDNAVAGHIKVVMDGSVRAEKVSDSAGKVTLEGGLEQGGTYYAVAMADEYTAFDVTLENSLGVNVWSGTVGAFDKLEGGGCIDLGHIGDADISSLALSFRSTEFDGFNLKSVVGYDGGAGKRIFGAEGCGTIKKDSTLTVRFYGLAPADYSASKVWYVFTIVKDGESRVLPIEEDGYVIPKSQELRRDLGTLSSSRNAAPWYYPYEDRRLMSGAGYAFGEANTYFIQYKGSSYGSTLDPDPSIPSSVVIDYRARGDLFKCPRPTDVEFSWLQGYNNSTPAWGKYTMDRSNIYNCDKYSFEVDAAAYRVTVTNNGAHAGAPILVMKDRATGEVLWAWTFWNIAADGTRVEAVDFGGRKIANMDIGHCSTKISDIVAKLKEIRYSTCYYQWGRPVPTFSASGTGVCFGETDSRNAAKPRVPVYDGGAVSVETALKHPGELIQNAYTPGKASENLADWLSGGMSACSDLWGGASGEGAVGVKSIYDPCPKGWRVPDAATYLAAVPEAKVCYSVTDFPQEHTTGYQGVYVGGVLFVTNGILATNTSADKYVSCGGYTHGVNATASGYGRLWTNTFSSGTKACDFRTDYFYVKFNGQTENTSRMIKVDKSDVGSALPVRCQKDDDER